VTVRTDGVGAAACAPPDVGIPSRAAQEAADAFERSRIGGVYFVICWALMCLTAGEGGLREWSIGGVFVLLALARLAVGLPLARRSLAPSRQLTATLGIMVTTMAAWGLATAFTLLHPDYSETPTVILFATSAFTTAYVYNYPMRLRPAIAALLLCYGPPFAAFVLVHRDDAAAVATGVFIHFSYLVLAARRAHHEYHRSIDLEYELRAQRDLFSRRSRIDPLTALANRREFNEILSHAVTRARGERSPLSLLLIDVDHFKGVNDRFGHAVGDECLVAISARLSRCFEASGELAARLGGEEFAVVLPGNDAATAERRAELFRAGLAAHPVVIDQHEIRVTVSIGVGSLQLDAQGESGALYRAVDAALYRAKDEGRNRVYRA
jgi:diguanylate cyclase